MTRAPQSSASFRGWDSRERQQAQADAIALEKDAADKTRAAEQRIEELGTLLRSSLGRDPRVELAGLRRRAAVPPPDLGPLAVPLDPPGWADFAPAPPGRLGRILAARQRRDAALRKARRRLAHAQEDHHRLEFARQQHLTGARREYERLLAEAEREAQAHNVRIDRIAAGLADGDRESVSEYVQIVLRSSPYPEGFPLERAARYVPESSLLAVEWRLPSVEVVPEYTSFRHCSAGQIIEPAARPVPEIREIYQAVIAQIALRTLREVFESDPAALIRTVLFSGRVHAAGQGTGPPDQQQLITLRATREQFETVDLSEPEFDPVECVRGYFRADICPSSAEILAAERATLRWTTRNVRSLVR
jgi:restriction system protein